MGAEAGLCKREQSLERNIIITTCPGLQNLVQPKLARDNEGVVVVRRAELMVLFQLLSKQRVKLEPYPFQHCFCAVETDPAT